MGHIATRSPTLHPVCCFLYTGYYLEYWYSKVVRRGEGFRLYRSRRWRQGRIRSPHRDHWRWLQNARRRSESELRHRAGPKRSSGSKCVRYVNQSFIRLGFALKPRFSGACSFLGQGLLVALTVSAFVIVFSYGAEKPSLALQSPIERTSSQLFWL